MDTKIETSNTMSPTPPPTPTPRQKKSPQHFLDEMR